MTNEDRTVSRDELERIKQQGAPSVNALLHIDGRAPHALRRRVVIGREPEGSSDIDTVAIVGDPLVSKTHLAFDVMPDGVVAIDLGSSNGTTLTIGGLTSTLPTEAWTPIGAGSIVTVGDTAIRVDVDGDTTDGVVDPPRTAIQPPPTAIVTSVPAAGKPLLETGCPVCGRAIVEHSRFCDGCGSAVGGIVAPGPLATVPPVAGPPTTAPWVNAAVSPQSEPPPLSGAASAPSGPRSKRPLMIAGGVAAVVVIVVVGWVVFGGSGGDDGPSATPLPQVAGGVDEVWAVDVDGADGVTGSASALFVLALDNDDAEVVSLAGGTGEERWATDVGRDVSYSFLRGVLDGVVLGRELRFR